MRDPDPCVTADLINELYRRVRRYVIQRRTDTGRTGYPGEFRLGDKFTAMVNQEEAVIVRLRDYPYSTVFSCLATGRVIDHDTHFVPELQTLLRRTQVLDDIADA